MANKYALNNRGLIIKAKTNDPFTIIPNKTIQDKNLSLKAKGLLTILLSLPEDWQIYKTNLYQFSQDGRDATIGAFNELVDKKYILKFERRDNYGLFGYDYVVFKEPQIRADDIENPFLKIHNGKTITDIQE